jgi:hypothetical protein
VDTYTKQGPNRVFSDKIIQDAPEMHFGKILPVVNQEQADTCGVIQDGGMPGTGLRTGTHARGQVKVNTYVPFQVFRCYRLMFHPGLLM